MNLKPLMLLILLVSVSLLANSTEREISTLPTSAVTEPVGEVFSPSAKTAAGVTRLTFYRPSMQPATGAASIELNGRYLTSLQRGSYSQLCLRAPANISLRSRLVYSGQLVPDYPEATTNLTLKSGEASYVRVKDVGSTQTTLELVNAKNAQSELHGTRRQIHAVSRIPGVVACDTDEQTEMRAAAPIESITLGTDALFAFGKSDIHSIFPYGQADLDRLIQRLKQRYGQFEQVQIRIRGHADPLGSYSANRRIAAQRAQTIRDYMVQGGIDPRRIVSEGRGATELLVRHCQEKISEESIACNKPNRRVVVDISVFVH